MLSLISSTSHQYNCLWMRKGMPERMIQIESQLMFLDAHTTTFVPNASTSTFANGMASNANTTTFFITKATT